MNREKLALEMAKKDGRNWEDLNDVMQNAYLHNADTEIARPPDREPEKPEGPTVTVCIHCKGEGWIGDKSCGECNPVGLPRKTEEAEDGDPKYLILSERMGNGETLEELADKARDIIKTSKPKPDKPRALKPSEYFCAKCQSPHRKTSKKGVKHLKYAAMPVPDGGIILPPQNAVAVGNETIIPLSEMVKDGETGQVNITVELDGKAIADQITQGIEGGIVNDADLRIDSRTGRDNQPTGSADTSESKQRQKSKAKKKARKSRS